MAHVTCSVEGCEKPAHGRGWCSAHYMYWCRHGDPGPVGDRRKRPKVPCAVEGCDSIAQSRGWCRTHYASWRRTGNPVRQIRPNYGSGRRVTPAGYVEVWAPKHPMANADGYVVEHRMVAWDTGILTDPSMSVHHLDEDKQNNDPSNLEAKTASRHLSDHVHERGWVENQYGVWPVAN